MDLWDEKPATNHLSYDTALCYSSNMTLTLPPWKVRMKANLHETLTVTHINLRHWFVTCNTTLRLKCPNQQYLNTYPHSLATLHNKYTCYVWTVKLWSV
jgi:hypothetical protein